MYKKITMHKSNTPEQYHWNKTQNIGIHAMCLSYLYFARACVVYIKYYILLKVNSETNDIVSI